MWNREGNQILSSKRSDVDASDKTFVALVLAELAKSPYQPLRALSCRSSKGVLVLGGNVPSYYLKQVAQRLAMGAVAGRMTIDNQVQVEE